MKRTNYGRYGLMILVVSCFFACSKQDDTYKEFLKGGEIEYRAKADTLTAYPGKNRVKLSWFISGDPDVTHARVFWNNGADSVEVPIDRTTGNDKFEVVLNNLEEGSHTFDVYTYDAAGNSSIKADVFAQVYGDNYASTLLARAVEGIAYNGQNLTVSWHGADQQSVGTEVTYMDDSDVQRKVTILPGESVSILSNYKPNSVIEYRTSYKPDSTAIDTFDVVNTLELQMEYRENIDLDKSQFSELELPGDLPMQNLTGMKMSNLWSGVFEGNQEDGAWYRSNNGLTFPMHFQFDLGARTKLNTFTMWQRGVFDQQSLVYNNANVKTWEIWGSNDPAPDGSFDGWTKLMDCTGHKPSGTPVGQRTSEDIAYAQAGDKFTLPANTPSVRYLRLNIVSIYGPQSAMFISEIAVNGSYWVISQ